MWVRLSQRQTLSRAMRAGGLLGCPVLTPQGCKEGYWAARGGYGSGFGDPTGSSELGWPVKDKPFRD